MAQTQEVITVPDDVMEQDVTFVKEVIAVPDDDDVMEASSTDFPTTSVNDDLNRLNHCGEIRKVLTVDFCYEANKKVLNFLTVELNNMFNDYENASLLFRELPQELLVHFSQILLAVGNATVNQRTFSVPRMFETAFQYCETEFKKRNYLGAALRTSLEKLRSDAMCMWLSLLSQAH